MKLKVKAVLTLLLMFSVHGNAADTDKQKVVSLNTPDGVVTQIDEELTLEMSDADGERAFTLNSPCRKISGVFHQEEDGSPVSVEIKDSSDRCIRGNLRTLKVFARFKDTVSIQYVPGGMQLRNGQGEVLATQGSTSLASGS